MAKKDEILDKKSKEELKDQIKEEFNTEFRSELVNEIVTDIRYEFDKDYKEEIKNQVKDEIVDEIKTDIRKEEKKVSRRKSFKIFRLTIYVLLLLAGCIYLIVRLFQTGNLDVVNKDLAKKVSEVVETKTTETTTESTTVLVKDLNYYVTNYGYLVDNVKISDVNLLRSSKDVSELAVSDKIAIAYNSVSDQVVIDGSLYTISEEIITGAYQTIFGSTDDYASSSFEADGLSFVYSLSSQSYIAICGSDRVSELSYNNITEVVEEENNLVFTAKVAYVKGEKVYSVNNLYSKVSELVDGSVDFASISNRLTSVKYTFESVDGTYKLIKIEKK